jgi:type I site-specific restriction-modification system R (restriction) subunit
MPGDEDTASVFGAELHSYIITDAIRDEKVLKFKVDYNDVRPQFKAWKRKQTRRNSAPLRINTLCCIRCGLAKSRITS